MSRRGAIIWFKVLGALVIVWVLLDCLGFPPPGQDLLHHLAIGWAAFLGRVVPKIQIHWGLVGSAVLYASALIGGSHFFLRWLYREMIRSAPSSPSDGGNRANGWHWRWTLSGFGLIVLMFVSGMAVIGVIHQTAWLMRSSEPMFENRRYRIISGFLCRENLEVIGGGLDSYAKDHGGKYPDDLGALLLENERIAASTFICAGSKDVAAEGKTVQEKAARLMTPGHCSYIYLGKGLATPIDPKRVVVYEQFENHNGSGMNALLGDGTVKWVERKEAERLLIASRGVAVLHAATSPTTKPQ